nr:hypothetical protein [Sphingopyxis flava]
MDKSHLFVALAGAAKAGDGNRHIGTAILKCPFRHRRCNVRINGLASLHIITTDAEQFAFGIRGIHDESPLKMGAQHRVAREDGCELTAGAALCGREGEFALRKKTRKLGGPIINIFGGCGCGSAPALPFAMLRDLVHCDETARDSEGCDRSFLRERSCGIGVSGSDDCRVSASPANRWRTA